MTDGITGRVDAVAPAVRAQLEGRVIAAFAIQHLQAAVLFRNRVIAIERDNPVSLDGVFTEIRCYGGACITSAAAALEAYINEEFMDPYSQLNAKLKLLPPQLAKWSQIEQRFPPVAKYELAVELLGGQSMALSAVGDARALTELRNALVHFKPNWNRRGASLIDRIAQRVQPSRLADAGSDFISVGVMSSSGMSWVLEAAAMFLEEFGKNRPQLTRSPDALVKLARASMS